jgi:hypothetical protein
VAEVLALQQEIDGENDDDAEGPDGAEEAHKELGGGLELGPIGVRARAGPAGVASGRSESRCRRR